MSNILITKRNGEEVSFSRENIIKAIIKSMKETDKGVDTLIAEQVAEHVEAEALEQMSLDMEYRLNVEGVQDRVEELLAELGRFDVSRRYVLYRNERAELRRSGWPMTDLQRDIYEQKYRDARENFEEFLERVSGGNRAIAKLIRDKKFMPAGRILAGRRLKNQERKVTMSNCYVLPKVEDSLESIFDTAKWLARTYSYGGGVGINISKLRPNGARVNNAAHTTTGAVSFMELYSLVTGLIGMRGRRGALMINMDVSHPDIIDFLNIKTDLTKVTKANISVNITDEFMSAVQNKEPYKLRFMVESTGEEISRWVDANELFTLLAKNNWDYAEPGVLFQDRINSWHLMSEDEDFEFAGVNPCFTGDMKLLTKEGYKRFDELVKQEKVVVINKDGQESEGKVWSSGEKEVVRIRTFKKDEITCTPDHVFMTSDGREVQAKDLKGERLKRFISPKPKSIDKFTKFGFIQGDGQLTRLASPDHHGLEVNIGQKDEDIYDLFKGDDYTLQSNGRSIYLTGYNEELKELGFSPQALPLRGLPDSYVEWSLEKKANFLQGCFSANGSVIRKHRVAYKTTSAELRDGLVKTLNEDFNLGAYFTTNKPKKILFDNGEYEVRESYDINIGNIQGIIDFAEKINFYHDYKREYLLELIDLKSPKVSSVKAIGRTEVYDFSEPLTHWGVVEDIIVHNCAEETLPAFGSCNLSSINLSEFVRQPFTEEAHLDVEEFIEAVHNGVIYLNEVLDENMELHPLKQQSEVSRDLRQIGLSIMGLADTFIKMGIRYGSNESIELVHKVGRVFINEALRQSAWMAKEKGTFPRYRKEKVLRSDFLLTNADPDVYALIEEYGLHNSQLLTIPPSGSISTLIGCSNGLEPLFQLSYVRKTESLHNADTYYRVMTPIVEEYMEFHRLESEEELPEYFVTTSNLNHEDRIKVQSAWQQYIDASISSTVNLPEETTIEEVKDLYFLAWKYQLKGITVFRDNSARIGILTKAEPEKKKEVEDYEVGESCTT